MMKGTWPENNYADSVVGTAETEELAHADLIHIAETDYGQPTDDFYVAPDRRKQ